MRTVVLAAVLLLATAAWAQAARPDPDYAAGFSERVLVDGLQAPTAVAWTPDGRMLVIEKGGVVKVATRDSTNATEILDISSRVNAAGDRGLLGVAVDTNYGSGAGKNRYVYLLYTYETGPLLADDGDTKAVSRLERFTLSATNQLTFDKVLLGDYVAGPCPPASNTLDCIPSDDLSHSIGTVRTDPKDGTLWVGSGDAASFGGVDDLAMRTYDEQSMAGKIMHIDREGKGLANHPFCPTTDDRTQVCTKLYAKGFRNPYRFSLRPGGGVMVGDVGWNQREEVNLIRQGGRSYGWPCYEGTKRTSGYRDRTDCQQQYTKEGTADANVPPQYEYLHEVGRTVIGGPTYQGGKYPSEFDGSIFYGDYGAKTIRRIVVDDQDQVVTTKDFASNWEGMVGIESTPDGTLAMVDIGTFSGDGAIREVVYQSRSPKAIASATPTSGATPLPVEFTGSGSKDPDGDPLTYSWEFGDGATSTEANPRHTYTQAGPVTARLTVSDGHGNSDATTIALRPGDDAPIATITQPAAGATYRNGQTITLRGSATDPQQGPLPASALRWQVLLHHDTHLHVAQEASGVDTTSFTAARDHDADSYYEVRLTARDASGLEGTRTIIMRPETVQMQLSSTPSGAPVSYGGRDFNAPFTSPTTIGFQTSLSAAPSFVRNLRTFYFDRWSDGGARERDGYTVPANDVSLRAQYLEDKAEGGAATASSVNDNSSLLAADSAVDGDPLTRWSSAFADGQHWQVDLGSSRTVDRVRLDWEAAYARRYRILTSPDGFNWSTAADEAISAPGPRLTQFTARKARYVRVLGLERATQYGISFWEARVLGPDDDDTAPETAITSGPEGTVRSDSASVGFSSTAGATFECRIDGGAWGACVSPKAYPALAQGQHVFEVRATATNGQTDPTPASRTFTVDTQGPETSITVGPSGTIGSAATSFSFSSLELGATFECKLDGQEWAGCTSPKALSGLADGPHTFSVRARDAAGNVDGTPDSRAFSVDTTPPDTTITGGPSGTVASTSASFEFTGESGGSFQCKLDTGAWESCATPKSYTGLGQGTHTFSVRARDALGNTDATAASRTFAVDTVGPDTSITAGPAAGSTITTSSTTFSFTSPETGAAFECRVDSGSWQACTSPKPLSALDDGQHTFAVRAKDAVGNADATPTSHTFTVDTAEPDTSLTSGPSGTVATGSLSFVFASGDAARFECSLDSGPYSDCSSPKGYTGLADGRHDFRVRGITPSGIVESTPATREFTVAIPAPVPKPAVGAGTPPAGGTQTPSAATPPPARPKPKPPYSWVTMSTRGLEAMFGLGDSGRSAVDAKGGRPGRFCGAPKRVKGLTASGRDRSARAFDGRDDRVELDPRALGTPRTLSVETWVKGGPQPYGTILSLSRNPVADGLGLVIDSKGRILLNAVSSDIDSQVRGPALGTSRHHVVATYDRARLRLYVDGVLRRSVSFRYGISWSRKRRATIGANADGRQQFKGTLDELSLYDRPMTAATVKAHFNAGR